MEFKILAIEMFIEINVVLLTKEENNTNNTISISSN